MTSKIIAVVGAVVGVSMASAAGSAAPTGSHRAATGHVRAPYPAARAEHLHARASAGNLRARSPAEHPHPLPRAEQPGRAGGTAKRRPASAPDAPAPGFYGRRDFGAGCRILHRHGPGSQAALAAVPVGADVSQVPGLSRLANAIRRASLTGMLDTASALTVFAPDNAAFDSLGPGNLPALLATRPDLVRVLKFHLVAGRVTPAELVKGRVLTTLAGTKLNVAHSGRSLSINNAAVTCGNVQTSNATVYVVSRFIVPMG